jgi:hypothetical protein
MLFHVFVLVVMFILGCYFVTEFNTKVNKWTDKEIRLLRKYYCDNKTSVLIEKLGRNRFSITQKAKYIGLRKSDKYLSVPNPFINRDNHNQVSEFQTIKDVGTVVMFRTGYLYIKKDDRKWVLLHHENWHKEHGYYPKRGHVLIFKDGDRSNADISNLQLLTNAEMLEKNGLIGIPEELKEVIILNRKIRKIINDNK